jgi:hypothetical protein
MIRPEQLQLRPAALRDPAGAVTGRVLRRDYHGHDTTVTLALPATAPTTDTPADETHILARTTGTEALPGSMVTITVAGPVVALPAESALALDDGVG